MFLRVLKLINWFLTKQKSTPIVEEPTSEKIIMETQIEPVAQIRDWAIEKIETLTQHGNAVDQLNALAIIDEFREWLNIPDGTQELDYLCLEDQDWTEDQEIDIR
jgi:hypothetical protein